MTFKLVIVGCVILATNVCHSILVGPNTNSSNSTGITSASAEIAKQENSLKIKELDGNSTFYYHSDEFLLNKSDKIDPQSAAKQQQANQTSINKWAQKQEDPAHRSLPAASLGSTSARNGRMLDLDALVGDMTASKANKLRQLESGNRQSRYLSDAQSNLDIGGGKRLHIQGFIPIVGVKDDSEPDSSPDEYSATATMKQRPKITQLTNNNNNNNNHHQDLPYAQSSMGHATFGVQRYLNTDAAQNQHQQAQLDQIYGYNQQQVDAKYSGATSMVDTLKRPIKKLTSLASGSPFSSSHQQASNDNSVIRHNSQQNCLCVPFYMCKNGYISESSLGKAQIQQMIQQQQQQQSHHVSQQPRQIDTIPSMDMKRGSVESVPVQQPPPVGAPVSLIDERSLDRDIVTALPVGDSQVGEVANISLGAGFSMDATTTTTTGPPPTQQPALVAGLESISSNGDQPTEANQQVNNSTLVEMMAADQQGMSDFSQDILGRMLGLKANQRQAGGGSSSSAPPPPPPTGACGLLRTCCNIPFNMYPSQQDLANERLVSQYLSGSQNKVTPMSSSSLNQPVVVEQNLANQALQKYQAAAHQMQLQQQQQQQLLQVPYGLPMPSQISRTQLPLNNNNNNNNNAMIESQQHQLLAHRTSNQYPSMSGRLQSSPAQQVSQYTRAAAPMQALQSFQQQPQQAQTSQPLPKNTRQPANAANIYQQQAGQQVAAGLMMGAGLGTRKLLEGRCGLRQSAGITGRVQNLQYHENSADFGEYPGQVAILRRLNGSESLFVCGGTLVSQYWVATAAHCIKRHSQAELKIRLGEWDVHRDDEFYSYVEKEVRDIVIHSEFTSGVYLVNDIALIRLDSPVDASLPHVNPACLPAQDEQFTGQRCWVTGWGKDSFGQSGSFQAVLREVELPVQGQQECESALRHTRLGPHYRLHSGFICAGGEGGKDACEGDGGSGLYCLQDGLIKVAGLVSWGIGCGQPGVPGVYVNMAHYRPWIENIISIDEDVYSKNSAPAQQR